MGKYQKWKDKNQKRKEFKALIEKISEEIKNIKNDGQYHILNTNFAKKILQHCINNNNLYGLNFYYQMYHTIDTIEPIIPLEVGKKMEQIINNPNYDIGIHRTGDYQNINEGNIYKATSINDILNNGLKNYGDLSSGANTNKNKIPPYKTIKKIVSIEDIMLSIKSTYKGNIGIILAFPKGMLNEEFEIIPGNETKIYNLNEDYPIIKPEYIIGLVIQDRGMCIYHSKEQFNQFKKPRTR